ncbi:MAG: hypothetical protein OJF49_000980 [Ktedonobacterales bacterium]|nr:MAG: hypothetical protein OJF49_000980 [Ktedonobacterales bacterium]
MRRWVLLHYKIPPTPSARRVYIWRKLKRLGALLLHDAVWVLPATAFTLEQFQWLAAEISEFDGSALVWEAHLNLAGRDEALVQQFLGLVEPHYRELLAELATDDADLAAVAQRYQQVYLQDYFHSELGQQVRSVLETAREAGGRQDQ